MGRKIVKILSVLVILAGLGVFLYPMATKYLAQYKSEKVIRQFEIQAKESSEGVKKDASDSKMQELLQELQVYNQRLYEEGQSDLRDPFDYETSVIDLSKYGFSQNVIGTLWIPRMDVELPIYLGANAENMALGAGLLGETSVPIGGQNTNVVLAAHRGWKGIPMFRDIQMLQPGDKIQITTPWDTLVYRVCDLKIILPGDSDEILIQEGRELVTLLTCHPYTQNYQRYMVVAERSMEEAKTKEEDLQETPGIQSSANEDETDGAQFSNRQIWLEDYGVWIGFAVIAAGMLMLCVFSRRRTKK